MKDSWKSPMKNIMDGNLPIRHILTLMGFLSFIILNMLKVSMSMALVCMVDWYALPNNSANSTCLYETNESRTHFADGDVVIPTDIQGHILAGFFYGLLATQYAGVLLAERMSAKYLLLMGVLISSVSTSLIPLVVYYERGVYIIFLQVLKGAATGMIIPAFSVLMGKWIPKSERFYSMCLIGSGIPLGAFLGTYVSALICTHLGWRCIFYIFGGTGLMWCLFWLVMIYESPLTHPYITHQEMLRILKSQVILPQRISAPYNYILKSRPVWAYVIVGFVSFWALSIFTTLLPIFMNTILKFGREMTGVWSSIPYVAEMLFFSFSCVLNERLKNLGRIADTKIHKWSIVIGLLGFGAFILVVPLTRCNRLVNIVCLVLALGFCGITFASTSYIPLQLSPHFSGEIAAIMNTFGALAGIIVPTMMGYLTIEKRSMDEWEILFYLSAALSVSALVVFLVFGSSSVQEWDRAEFRGSREQVLVVEVDRTPDGKIDVLLREEEEEDPSRNE